LVDREQVEREKARVYSPLKEGKRSIGWKELNIGICKIMQDYCGEYRTEETLKIGLRLLKELRESEASMVYAGNPHELARALECQMLITVGEMVMQASMARKASSVALNFHRLDFPTQDPPEWQKLLPIRLEDGQVVVRELSQNYHLLPPYAPSYEENYRLHCGA
jgi:succinate dehydrogenase/fumarate reductase flavoprotein subunit